MFVEARAGTFYGFRWLNKVVQAGGRVDLVMSVFDSHQPNRIECISPAALGSSAFYEAFVRKSTPVILKGFGFSRLPSDLFTRDGVLRRFGQCTFVATESHVNLLRALERDVYEPSMLKIASLLDIADGTQDLMIVNQQSPASLHSAILDADLVTGALGDSKSRFFYGKKNDVTPIHFDRDHREVMFLQLTGRKRVAIVEPVQGYKLAPIANFSGIFIDRLPELDRETFWMHVHARVGEVEAGDLLYFPALCWHFVEYSDESMSVNLRIKSSEANEWCASNLFPNHLTQLFGACLLGKCQTETAKWQHAFKHIMSLRNSTQDRYQAHRAINEYLHEILHSSFVLPDDIGIPHRALENAWAQQWFASSRATPLHA